MRSFFLHSYTKIDCEGEYKRETFGLRVELYQKLSLSSKTGKIFRKPWHLLGTRKYPYPKDLMIFEVLSRPITTPPTSPNGKLLFWPNVHSPTPLSSDLALANSL
jgi:hypothetical protein